MQCSSAWSGFRAGGLESGYGSPSPFLPDRDRADVTDAVLARHEVVAIPRDPQVQPACRATARRGCTGAARSHHSRRHAPRDPAERPEPGVGALAVRRDEVHLLEQPRRVERHRGSAAGSRCRGSPGSGAGVSQSSRFRMRTTAGTAGTGRRRARCPFPSRGRLSVDPRLPRWTCAWLRGSLILPTGYRRGDGKSNTVE